MRLYVVGAHPAAPAGRPRRGLLGFASTRPRPLRLPPRKNSMGASLQGPCNTNSNTCTWLRIVFHACAPLSSHPSPPLPPFPPLLSPPPLTSTPHSRIRPPLLKILLTERQGPPYGSACTISIGINPSEVGLDGPLDPSHCSDMIYDPSATHV